LQDLDTKVWDTDTSEEADDESTTYQSRRSTLRGEGPSHTGAPLSEQLKVQLKSALDAGTHSELGLRFVSFTSGEQTPRSKLTQSGVRGDAEELMTSTQVHLIKESLEIRNFFGRAGLGGYSRTQIWKWIVHTNGMDIVAIYHDNTVVGATLGFYFKDDNVYLTHLTAVHSVFRFGAGIGSALRNQQITNAIERGQKKWCRPPMIASLSANPDPTNPIGAVNPQIRMLAKLGYRLVDNYEEKASEMIDSLNARQPELGLKKVKDTHNVTALLFSKTF
jgi:hypothetical protein